MDRLADTKIKIGIQENSMTRDEQSKADILVEDF